MSTELETAVQASNVNQETTVAIRDSFKEFLEQAKEWEDKALAITITSEDQTDLMKEAGIARKALKNIRVTCDKKRKEMKADALAYGKAVQSAYNLIEEKIKPLEKHLEDQEKFIENLKIEKQNALREERNQECEQYSEFMPLSIDLGLIGDEEYLNVLNGAKIQYDQKQEALKKEEDERIKAEQERVAEEARIKEENRILKEEAEKERLEQEKKEAAHKAELERLKAEQDKKDAEARKIAEAERLKRKEEEKILREAAEKERLEKEALEAEIKRKEEEAKAAEEAENKRLAEEAKAKALAPDKDKIKNFLVELENLSVELPTVDLPEAIDLVQFIKSSISRLVEVSENKVNNL